MIYIYGTVTMVATSCDLNASRCTTKVPQVRFHGSRRGVFVGHRPPWDPGDPLLSIKYKKIYKRAAIEVLRLFRRSTHTRISKGPSPTIYHKLRESHG